MVRSKIWFARGLVALLCAFGPLPSAAQELRAVTPDDPQGQVLVERLRKGGHVLFFRHADTTGMPCDKSFRVGDRPGQRNISEDGRRQSRAIGEAFEALRIPVADPVLAGPVYRARDTAEEAFGAKRVRVTDSLLADDYAGGRLQWVLDEHRQLFREPPTKGGNRVLVGHRTPAIMVIGPRVGGRAFPEGAALVLDPAGREFGLLGILHVAPLPGRGFHAC